MDKLTYPWLEDFAALRKLARFDRYATVARRIPIDGVLRMEVDVAENDIEAKAMTIVRMMLLGGHVPFRVATAL